MRNRNRSTRVVLATRNWLPEVTAASFRLAALAEALVSEDCDVVVLTVAPPRGSGPYVAPEHTVVRRWPVLRDRNGQIRGYLQYLSFDLPLIVRLLFVRRPRFIVSEPPPTTGIVVAGISKLRRTPYVYFAADIWSLGAVGAGAPSLVVAALRALEGYVFRHAALVLAVNSEVVAEVLRLSQGSARAVDVGNGVDTTVFRPDGSAEIIGCPYFVYAGTMSEWQGADVFVRALTHITEPVPDFRLVFIGWGSEYRRLQSLADELAPGRTLFKGVLRPSQTAAWLRGSRAALASMDPRAAYDAARPTKVYAAAACGTPVLYAGPGAGSQVVASARLGWTVPHDPEAVAASIIRLLNTEEGATCGSDIADWVESNASLRRVAGLATKAMVDSGLLSAVSRSGSLSTAP